jgi:hypothetical protein
MAEYINIRGQSIEVVASDPANPTLGQIWYNSTSNTLKGGGVTTAGAWSTGNALATGRYGLTGGGITNCSVSNWWIPTLVVLKLIATEEYDGTAWTSGGNLIFAARNALCSWLWNTNCCTIIWR